MRHTRCRSSPTWIQQDRNEFSRSTFPSAQSATPSCHAPHAAPRRTLPHHDRHSTHVPERQVLSNEGERSNYDTFGEGGGGGGGFPGGGFPGGGFEGFGNGQPMSQVRAPHRVLRLSASCPALSLSLVDAHIVRITVRSRTRVADVLLPVDLWRSCGQL